MYKAMVYLPTLLVFQIGYRLYPNSQIFIQAPRLYWNWSCDLQYVLKGPFQGITSACLFWEFTSCQEDFLS
jgi:hypothetical protein